MQTFGCPGSCLPSTFELRRHGALCPLVLSCGHMAKATKQPVHFSRFERSGILFHGSASARSRTFGIKVATATCRVEFSPQNLDTSPDFQGFDAQGIHNAMFELQGAITDLFQACIALKSRQPHDLARSRGNCMSVRICHQTVAKRVAFNPNRISRTAIENGNDLRTGCAASILKEGLSNQTILQISHFGSADWILGIASGDIDFASLTRRANPAKDLGKIRPNFRTGGSDLRNKQKRYDCRFNQRPCPGFTSFSSIALVGSRYIWASTSCRLMSVLWRSVSTIAPIIATRRIRPASWNSRKYWS